MQGKSLQHTKKVKLPVVNLIQKRYDVVKQDVAKVITTKIITIISYFMVSFEKHKSGPERSGPSKIKVATITHLSATVNNLITAYKNWDTNLLKQILPAQDAIEVIKTPIS